MAIHPLAVVDPEASVHPDASIGPFCCLRGKVVVEAGVELRNHVTVYGRTTIGRGSILFPNCVIASDPQDLKFRGEDSEVRIGANCRIHEYVTISKGTAGGGMLTSLGDDCLVMAGAHVAHDCRLGDRVVLGNNSQLAGHVVVGRRATISGMCGVHHFATIGELTFIGAMSGVRYDAPPYCIVDGHPAEVRSLNIVGLRRDGVPDDEIRVLKDVFRALFHDKAPMSEGLVRARDLLPAQETRAHRLVAWAAEHLEASIKGRIQEAHRVAHAAASAQTNGTAQANGKAHANGAVAMNGHANGNGHVNGNGHADGHVATEAKPLTG
ncbi:MAG TPA: acyl-ACP--UDP-N-acetylglucosamine O-acyltransferase [Planctomycetota bacterium]|nr:acyl-ACP--UDP-N-acetylglucosamine O-acyltransferase [Planctomycetota bacterium]